MKKNPPKEQWDPIVDEMVWLFRLIEKGLQLLVIIVLRSTVNVLRSLDIFFASEFTNYLFETYGTWFNNRLVSKALNYEGVKPEHFRVTVESTETITSYMIAIVKYEDMTLRNIKSYVPVRINMELSIPGRNIQVQKIDKNHVKVVMYLGQE